MLLKVFNFDTILQFLQNLKFSWSWNGIDIICQFCWILRPPFHEFPSSLLSANQRPEYKSRDHSQPIRGQKDVPRAPIAHLTVKDFSEHDLNKYCCLTQYISHLHLFISIRLTNQPEFDTHFLNEASKSI